jgi:hypothetical protein
MTRGVGALASALLFLGLSSSFISCRAREKQSATGAVDVPPPPDTLLIEGTLRDPDAFWSRVREGAGGPFMSQPATAASFILRRAHLDPRLANFVLGGLPFHFAVGEAADGSFAFVIAMKVRDLKATESTIERWDAGAHRTVAGMEFLSPLVGPDAPQTAVALAPSGYLVFASSESGLSTFGPYAAIALPTKSAAESSLELRAARGALARAGVKATNLAAWATSNLLGVLKRIAPPGFDASVFVACVNPLLVGQAAMIADLEDARVDVDTGDGELHTVATLTPRAGDSAFSRCTRLTRPRSSTPPAPRRTQSS